MIFAFWRRVREKFRNRCSNNWSKFSLQIKQEKECKGFSVSHHTAQFLAPIELRWRHRFTGCDLIYSRKKQSWSAVTQNFIFCNKKVANSHTKKLISQVKYLVVVTYVKTEREQCHDKDFQSSANSLLRPFQHYIKLTMTSTSSRELFAGNLSH